jgi:hypothetical protein
LTVAVYVVSDVGETLAEPFAIGVIAPAPLLIEPLVALLVVQERVAELPEVIVEGLAERLQVGALGGGGTGVTVTEMAHVTVPPGPLTVAVYVVLVVGETLLEPPETGVAAPMLLSIDMLVAFAVVHDSVEKPPEVMVVGIALSAQVGAVGGGRGGGTGGGGGSGGGRGGGKGS